MDEGLVISAALAGEAALETFLVIGFTRNHITEGIGIAAPIAKKHLPLWQFIYTTALLITVSESVGKFLRRKL